MRDSPSRLVFAALIALLGFWLLSHLTVATWLTRQANERAHDWSLGLSPWRWDFSDLLSVVRPGSHGLADARKTDDGLSLTLPDDGVASLSLAMRGERADLTAVDQVRIELDSSAPLKVGLLSLQPHREWLLTQLDAGKHRLELPLNAHADAHAEVLLLRIESQPGATIELYRLTLMARDCSEPQACSDRIEVAPAFFSPERLLAYRDARLIDEPAIAIVGDGRFGRAGQWLGRHLPDFSANVQRLLGAGLSCLLLFGLAYRVRRKRPAPSASRAAWELAATLGVALLLLLAGWPARDTPWSMGLLLALCVASLAALPIATPRTWRWLGDKPSWKGALIFTFTALLLTSPLALFDQETRASAQALESWRYPAWALLQQWLLIAAIMPRIRQFWPDQRGAALLGGVIFGLLHAPNFALMVFTFAGGSIWAWLGQRDRALLPLATSHLALGLWLMYIAPLWLLRSAEIGGRYLMAP